MDINLLINNFKPEYVNNGIYSTSYYCYDKYDYEIEIQIYKNKKDINIYLDNENEINIKDLKSINKIRKFVGLYAIHVQTRTTPRDIFRNIRINNEPTNVFDKYYQEITRQTNSW